MPRPDDLLKAHAYAYGGAIIQDMGYYPSGSKLFSDLTHYFRSGDFIVSLLHNASISTSTPLPSELSPITQLTTTAIPWQPICRRSPALSGAEKEIWARL